jgi:hypothetical protein
MTVYTKPSDQLEVLLKLPWIEGLLSETALRHVTINTTPRKATIGICNKHTFGEYVFGVDMFEETEHTYAVRVLEVQFLNDRGERIYIANPFFEQGRNIIAQIARAEMDIFFKKMDEVVADAHHEVLKQVRHVVVNDIIYSSKYTCRACIDMVHIYHVPQGENLLTLHRKHHGTHLGRLRLC